MEPIERGICVKLMDVATSIRNLTSVCHMLFPPVSTIKLSTQLRHSHGPDTLQSDARQIKCNYLKHENKNMKWNRINSHSAIHSLSLADRPRTSWLRTKTKLTAYMTILWIAFWFHSTSSNLSIQLVWSSIVFNGLFFFCSFLFSSGD